MLQSVLFFIRRDKWTTIQKCTCVHDQTHQQTDRNSIDAERKSNESHAAHLLLFFSLLLLQNASLLQCNFAHCLSLSRHCIIISLAVPSSSSTVSSHSTAQNEIERHATVFSLVPSSFGERVYHTKPSNCYCSLCVCQCIELCRNRVCALVTLNRLVGRSFYIFVLWHFS